MGAGAVLLVGHGSHLSGDSSRPVHHLADRLRAAGGFSEVHVAFWKEEPQLHNAFDLVESDDVAVVPVFTSEGYFTERVLPRELGLDGEGHGPGGRRVRYCRPVGSHPAMASVVLQRAREAVSLTEEERAAATLIVIGHGTERHPDSGGTTYALVERLRQGGAYAEVLPAFLDQPPEMAEVIARVRTRHVVAVPFFISDGWHAGTTIPRDLGSTDDDDGDAGGRRLWYARSVGSHEAMREVVRELVAESGFTPAESGSTPAEPGAPSASGPHAASRVHGASGASAASGAHPATHAREAFLRWIRAAPEGVRTYLQVVVRIDTDGRFEIRHVADRDASPRALESRRGPAAALELAARTDGGSHRPLRTAPDLRTGWRLTDLDAHGLWEACNHLYPTVPVHQLEWARGILHHRRFAEVARRQTGMYRGLEALDGVDLARVVDRCCGEGACLRVPTWHDSCGGDAVSRGGPGSGEYSGFGEDPGPGEGPRFGGGVFDSDPPCPRPCSILLSAAKKALDPKAGSG